MHRFLLGYNVESSDWSRPGVLVRFLGAAVKLHRELALPCTFFVRGQSLEEHPDEFRRLRDECGELVDLQQFTYSALPLKTVCQENYRGRTVFHGGAPRQCRDDIARASEVMERILGEPPDRARRPARILSRAGGPARPARDRQRTRHPVHAHLHPQLARLEPARLRDAAVPLFRRGLPGRARNPRPGLAGLGAEGGARPGELGAIRPPDLQGPGLRRRQATHLELRPARLVGNPGRSRNARHARHSRTRPQARLPGADAPGVLRGVRRNSPVPQEPE